MREDLCLDVHVTSNVELRNNVSCGILAGCRKIAKKALCVTGHIWTFFFVEKANHLVAHEEDNFCNW